MHSRGTSKQIPPHLGVETLATLPSPLQVKTGWRRGGGREEEGRRKGGGGEAEGRRRGGAGDESEFGSALLTVLELSLLSDWPGVVPEPPWTPVLYSQSQKHCPRDRTLSQRQDTGTAVTVWRNVRRHLGYH